MGTTGQRICVRGAGWRVFEARPACVGEARGWLVQVIRRYGPEADPGDAALMISELFANAVLHGPGGRVLSGYCLRPDGIRLVVCDGGGTTTPELREADTLAEGGRGLHVVAGIATAWGHFRVGSAQVVWCDLGKPMDEAGADVWGWLHLVLAAIRFRPAGKENQPAGRGRTIRPGRVISFG